MVMPGLGSLPWGKGGIPEGGGTPLILTLLTLVVATEAGDTHPTEMLSCFVMISFFFCKKKYEITRKHCTRMHTARLR